MNVAVINGTMHKGSTYHCAHLFLEQLKQYEDLNITEFFLPGDMPQICVGCFSCVINGEKTCPHCKQVAPITAALDDADLIIMASPVYVFDVSGQLKTLLDHYAYRWIPHRPNPKMFHKIGLAVSSAAGGGTSRTNKTMKINMNYWGIQRIFTFGVNVFAAGWDHVSPEKKTQIEKKIKILSKKISKSYRKADKIRPTLFSRIMFGVIKGMQKSSNANPADRDYWKAQGWLDGKKPWENVLTNKQS